MVRVSPDAGRPSASPVSSGGAYGIAADRAVRHGVLAPRHPLGHLGPVLEQSMTSSRLSVVTSNAHEVHPVLCRRDDARLVLAAERHRSVEPAKSALARGRRARPAHPRLPRRRRAAVTPAAPNSFRLDRPERRSLPDLPQAFPAHWGAMTPCTWLTSLPNASMASRQLLALRLGHLVVEHEAVALAVLLEQGLDVGEPLVDPLAQVGVALVEDRPQRATAVCEPSTLALKSHRSVWLKMSSSPVILLVAISSSSPCAPPAIWVESMRLRRRLHAGVEFLDVGHQLVGDRVGVGLQPGHPQLFLEPVEAGPLLAGLQVGLAQVDRGSRSPGTTRRPARCARSRCARSGTGPWPPRCRRP